MGEYIIENITQKDWMLLEENNIPWYPESLDSCNVIILGEENATKAKKLLGKQYIKRDFYNLSLLFIATF